MKRKPLSTLSADVIALVHFAWAAFFWGGAVAVIFYHAFAPIQAWSLVIAFALNVPFKYNCVLTTLEEKLRRVENPRYTSNGSFLATYLNKFLGTKFTTRQANISLAIGFFCSCALTLFAYLHP